MAKTFTQIHIQTILSISISPSALSFFQTVENKFYSYGMQETGVVFF
ncbi:MAG: hypothetical protein LBS09_02500 [Bacteroidales bacterium]|nr:hypothetical protein [Bacteroidales bacterium]